MPQIISLTTDFGLKDSYVAEMKAVILGIYPTANIVDVTHLVDKFNVRTGAFMLTTAAPYFPKGTIHVAVVDPGVGSKRRPIIVQTEHGFFVGPDNGLLVLAAQTEGVISVHKIESRRFMLPHVSGTFHGRDIFAPVAAHLANDVTLEEFGPKITDITIPEFAKTDRKPNSILGEVLHIDDFGNIITNIPTRELAAYTNSTMHVDLSSQTLEVKLSKTYSDVKPHETLALVGSHNYLELALNQGNAAEIFSVKVGDKVTISKI